MNRLYIKCKFVGYRQEISNVSGPCDPRKKKNGYKETR